MKKPLILMILDGFGISLNEGNAIVTAKTPNIGKIFGENPITKIGASGMDVGLPDGQMGNSEVGHTNIGAGRVVYQELTEARATAMPIGTTTTMWQSLRLWSTTMSPMSRSSSTCWCPPMSNIVRRIYHC